MTKKTKSTIRIFTEWFFRISAIGALSIACIFLLTSFGAFGDIPTVEEIDNPNLNVASQIISSDGKLIGKFAIENRTPIKFKDIPENVVHALIATEDERFYNHSGIDLRSTARAICKPGSGGASTITQQLAKNLFTKNVSKSTATRIIQKLKEWIVAVKLEKQYSKNDIIAMYFNAQDFVFNAVGIRSASRIYFGKEPKALQIEEAAVIVAMLKNPVLYNPNIDKFKNNCLNRRNVVFNQMVRNNFITEKEKDSLTELPLKIDYTPETHYTGTATYFRGYLKKYMSEWVENNKKINGEKYNIYEDGLKIYVTLDSRMQINAEKAVFTHMANLQKHFNKEQKRNTTAPFYNLSRNNINEIINSAKYNSSRYRRLKKSGKTDEEIDNIFNRKTPMTVFSYNGEKDTIMSPMDSIKYYKSFLRSGLLSMNPENGHIKAWVGGIDYKYFKYDAVEQQKRQVGSTFKPFVYAAAIDKLNIPPCHVYPNQPYTIGKGKHGIPESWTPANAKHKYGGYMTMKTALAKSVNVISARLIDTVSPRSVVNFAHQLGVKSDIPIAPAIALGAVDLSLLEMVNAYSTFVNKGVKTQPLIITRIEDRDGRIIQEFLPEKQEVISKESAYIVLDLLQGVINKGSGARLKSTWTSVPQMITGFPYKFKNQIAGKTGTTQNQSDGWFIGAVPNLVTGVWTGGEDRAVHFKGIRRGQGASMSLPSWALYMKECYKDEDLGISKSNFERPKSVSTRLNCPEIEEVIIEKKEFKFDNNIVDNNVVDDISF